MVLVFQELSTSELLISNTKIYKKHIVVEKLDYIKERFRHFEFVTL